MTPQGTQTTRHGSDATLYLSPFDDSLMDSALYTDRSWDEIVPSTRDFAVWAQPKGCLIRVYCEGDVTLIESPDRQTWEHELSELRGFSERIEEVAAAA